MLCLTPDFSEANEEDRTSGGTDIDMGARLVLGAFWILIAFANRGLLAARSEEGRF